MEILNMWGSWSCYPALLSSYFPTGLLLHLRNLPLESMGDRIDHGILKNPATDIGRFVVQEAGHFYLIFIH